MMTFLASLEAEYPYLLISIYLIFGSVIGSFLNVVILRLPVMLEREWASQSREILCDLENRGKERDQDQPEGQVLTDSPVAETYNLVFPNSHCPYCQHAIKPWENIPVLSYLFLKGRCASCKTAISIRYPLVEILTAILTMIVLTTFGLNLTGLACCIFTWSLISLALIDYDHKYLPDDITLPLLWLGLICNYFDLVTVFSNAFWGAIAGYMSLWLVYQAFKLVTGKEGMGFGDFKLLGMLGAWMGWQLIPLIVVLSSITGAIIGGSLIALGRDRSNPIPFGPFLAIAGWIALLWGPEINLAYFRLVT